MMLFRNKVITLVSISALVLAGIITFIHLYFSSSVEKIKVSYAGTQVQLLQNHIKENSSSTALSLIRLSENKNLIDCIVQKSILPGYTGDLLAMAGFSFMAITDSGLAPVVYYPSTRQDYLRLIPGNPGVFKKTLSEGRVTLFYNWKNDSLFEISAIPVKCCTGTDNGINKAWMFAGRYIQHELTDKLIMQVPGKITICRPPQASGSEINLKTNTYISTLPLYGWDNFPVASLRIETRPELMKILSSQQLSLTVVLAILAVVFLFFMYRYLNRYYIMPLKLISLAIRQKDPAYISRIRDNDTDFNSLQHLIMNVYSQEKLLSEIMKSRNTGHMNSFHAAILSRINEAVYAYDHKGIITYWNKAAENLYRIPEPDAISKIVQELIKTKWENPEEELKQSESLRTAGTWQGMLVQELPDGSEIFIEASISCLYDNNEALLGYLSIIRKPTGSPLQN